jgi:hypothetical protein
MLNAEFDLESPRRGATFSIQHSAFSIFISA